VCAQKWIIFTGITTETQLVPSVFSLNPKFSAGDVKICRFIQHFASPLGALVPQTHILSRPSEVNIVYVGSSPPH